jgi:hypothetical protein
MDQQSKVNDDIEAKGRHFLQQLEEIEESFGQKDLMP